MTIVLGGILYHDYPCTQQDVRDSKSIIQRNFQDKIPQDSMSTSLQ